VKELMGVSRYLFRYVKDTAIQVGSAVGYPLFTSILSIFMNVSVT